MSCSCCDADVSDAASGALIARVRAEIEMWKSRGVDMTTMQASLKGRASIGIGGEYTGEIRGCFTDAYGPGIAIPVSGT